MKIARQEARQILSRVQYEHMTEVLKRLVHFGDQNECGDLDIKLQRVNLRVFFGAVRPMHQIVVVKTYHKKEDGSTPRHVLLAAEDRLEDYEEGEHRGGLILYPALVPANLVRTS
jgi:hypothetical protein